jgi:hypothetical protein
MVGSSFVTKWVFMSVCEGLVGTLEAKSEILDVVHVVGATATHPMGRQIGAESASKTQNA